MRLFRPIERGFVLPSVLVYIAAFSLILMSAAAALDRGHDIIQRLDNAAQKQNALDQSEAIAKYLFLTSPGVPGHLDLSGTSKSAESILLGNEAAEDPEEQEDRNLWSAAGGILLLSETPVKSWVVYEDLTGLISLQSVDAEIFNRLMSLFDISENEARQMYAALRDYQDDDNLRRQLGGERADYRMRNKPPPTNSPLRTPAELGFVLGWDQFQAIDSLAFLSLVTTSTALEVPRQRFSPEPIQSVIDLDSIAITLNADPLVSAAQSSTLPGNGARFSLIVEDRLSNSYRVRLIEIQRQPNAASRPYSRTLITEQTASSIPERWLPDETHEVYILGQP